MSRMVRLNVDNVNLSGYIMLTVATLIAK
jgi:hypothetical protein